MAKKNFSQGIDAFFGDHAKDKQEHTSVQKQEKPPSLSKRATFIVDVDQMLKLRSLAYWERTTISSLLNQALSAFLSSKGEKYVNEAVDHYKINSPDEI